MSKPVIVKLTPDGEDPIEFTIPADLAQHMTLDEFLKLLIPPSPILENITTGKWTMDQLWNELRVYYVSVSE